MSHYLRTLLQDVLGVETRRRPECLACQDLLHAYVEAELEGLDVAAHFPTVKRHLANCPDCRAESLELEALFVAERLGKLIEPPLDPVFDLSFLSRPGTTSTSHS